MPSFSPPNRTNSRRLLERDEQFIPGGLASFNRRAEPTIAFERAIGSRMWDVDGHEYINYHAAFSAYVLGHICQLAGSHRHVGIGSDLDGGFGSEQSPYEVETNADVQKLAEVLTSRGFSAATLDDVFHGNFVRFFIQHLPTALACRS